VAKVRLGPPRRRLQDECSEFGRERQMSEPIPSKTIPSWLTARDSKKIEKREESYEDKAVVGGQSKREPA
jgi:hypothetical protein